MLRPSSASAHARLLRADPPDPCAPFAGLRASQPAPPDLPCASGVVLAQPPSLLRLFFTERVQLAGRGVRVWGPAGQRVDRGPPRVLGVEVQIPVDATSPGTYRVVWRVIAVDTHPARGAYLFSVGHPTQPAAPGTGPAVVRRSAVGLALQALARTVHFAGYALCFGIFAFRRAVLVPRSLTEDRSIDAQVWRLIGAGVLGLLVAAPLAVLAQTVSLSVPPESPIDADVLGGALDSSFGLVLGQRVGAAALVWVLAGAVRQGAVREAAAAWAVLGLGLAVALIDGEAAHAVGARPVWAGFGANVLHESAMGWWIGAVLGLLGIWHLPAVVPRRGEIVTVTARLVASSLAILFLSGTLMAVQHLAGLRDLIATSYGRTLAGKIVVLAVAVTLAWAAAAAPFERRSRWWMWEAAALLGVLGVAGLLVSLPPPV